MLNYPEHGWCEVAIGTFKERASYLTDLPLNILETVIHTLKTGKPAVCECDAEGYDYLIVFTQDNVEIILSKEETKLFSFDTDIKTVSREILNDIQPKIQLWTDWLEDSDEFENRQKNERKLTELCTEVEDLLNDKRENIKKKNEIEECVNANIPHGCCGGCV